MSGLPRLIDANANRAREALRMLEDIARFHLDDRDLTAKAKSLRHELREALDRFPSGWLVANRDTTGDVGTELSTPAESVRRDLLDVTIAAGKRASEALRVLEEASKVVDADRASSFESLRYRTYELDRVLLQRLGSGRARQWRLCLLLTESLCFRPWREALRASLEAGADCIQVREKSLDDGALVARVREIVDVARPIGVSVIVNDRVDIALAAGADGVHLGTTDLAIDAARRIAGRTLIIGASTHDLDEADRAVRAGADYCGIGAMFATSLKPERTPSGVNAVRAFIERYPGVPHLAIGGITPDNIQTVTEAGARGVAVSSCVCASREPAAVVKALLQNLSQ